MKRHVISHCSVFIIAAVLLGFCLFKVEAIVGSYGAASVRVQDVISNRILTIEQEKLYLTKEDVVTLMELVTDRGLESLIINTLRDYLIIVSILFTFFVVLFLIMDLKRLKLKQKHNQLKINYIRLKSLTRP